MNRFIFICAITLVTPAIGACNSPPTHVAQGESYVTGVAKYDELFETVHRYQTGSAEWAEVRRKARHPLVHALELTSDTSDEILLRRYTEAERSSALRTAATETARAEDARSRSMRDAHDRLETLLAKIGTLRSEISANFKSPEKASEVRRELAAASEALDAIMLDAGRQARDAERFVNRLGVDPTTAPPTAKATAAPAKPKPPPPPPAPRKPAPAKPREVFVP